MYKYDEWKIARLIDLCQLPLHMNVCLSAIHSKFNVTFSNWVLKSVIKKQTTDTVNKRVWIICCLLAQFETWSITFFGDAARWKMVQRIFGRVFISPWSFICFKLNFCQVRFSFSPAEFRLKKLSWGSLTTNQIRRPIIIQGTSLKSTFLLISQVLLAYTFIASETQVTSHSRLFRIKTRSWKHVTIISLKLAM